MCFPQQGNHPLRFFHNLRSLQKPGVVCLGLFLQQYLTLQVMFSWTTFPRIFDSLDYHNIRIWRINSSDCNTICTDRRVTSNILVCNFTIYTIIICANILCIRPGSCKEQIIACKSLYPFNWEVGERVVGRLGGGGWLLFGGSRGSLVRCRHTLQVWPTRLQ